MFGLKFFYGYKITCSKTGLHKKKLSKNVWWKNIVCKIISSKEVSTKMFHQKFLIEIFMVGKSFSQKNMFAPKVIKKNFVQTVYG